MLAFMLMGLLVVACANPPSPPLASVDCDSTEWTPAPANLLGCEEAVAVALAALPASTRPISRIQFRWGDFCGGAESCPVGPPNRGIVVFSFGGSRPLPRSYVQIERSDDGQVRRVSELMPHCAPPLAPGVTLTTCVEEVLPPGDP
jgi:hypothetical protein